METMEPEQEIGSTGDEIILKNMLTGIQSQNGDVDLTEKLKQILQTANGMCEYLHSLKHLNQWQTGHNGIWAMTGGTVPLGCMEKIVLKCENVKPFLTNYQKVHFCHLINIE